MEEKIILPAAQKRRGGAPLAVAAWSEEWLWDRLVWHDHPQLFGASTSTASTPYPTMAANFAVRCFFRSIRQSVRPSECCHSETCCSNSLACSSLIGLFF